MSTNRNIFFTGSSLQFAINLKDNMFGRRSAQAVKSLSAWGELSETSWFLLQETCVVKTSTSVNHKQPAGGAWQLAATVMKCGKLLRGPRGSSVYEDVAARAPVPVCCLQHADTAGSWRQRDRAGVWKKGHIQSVWFSISSPLTILNLERMENREK